MDRFTVTKKLGEGTFGAVYKVDRRLLLSFYLGHCGERMMCNMLLETSRKYSGNHSLSIYFHGSREVPHIR